MGKRVRLSGYQIVNSACFEDPSEIGHLKGMEVKNRGYYLGTNNFVQPWKLIIIKSGRYKMKETFFKFLRYKG